MNSHNKQTKSRQSLSFQPKKIHIEGFVVMEALRSYEKDLKNSLSKYGSILDVKVLKNCKLKSGRKLLRLRHL